MNIINSLKNKYILLLKIYILCPKVHVHLHVYAYMYIHNILTSLKKSPTHLAIIRTIITGKPKDIPCVASIKIAVKLIVIRTTPPNCAAAPNKAYLPGSNTSYEKWNHT